MNQKNFIISMAFMLFSSVYVMAEPLHTYYLDNPNMSIVNQTDANEVQRTFLERYVYADRQIQAGAAVNDFFFAEEATNEEDCIEPLLGDITYNQEAPYNNKCPYINGNRRAVTGCVATAMAQVMRYYAYPKCGIGEVTYKGSTGASTINLANYPFEWEEILTHYQGVKYTDAQADAVASLMLACGASINMDYNADASGSQTAKVVSAMRNNFGFDKSIDVLQPDQQSYLDYLEEDYGSLMREEFHKGHPIIYGGQPAAGESGHCFVIDGYKVIDGIYYYHVNWGWEGAYNGYFLLDNLKPEGNPSYSGHNVTIVYNIFPPNWTDVEEIAAETTTLDYNAPIYSILGHQVSPQQLQKGNIYLQKGKKILFQ